MSLLTALSQLANDLRTKDDSVLRCAEAAHNLAVHLANEHARFWSLPTDRLLAVLNYDVQATLAMFAANTSAGTSVNALLDQLNLQRFSTRAPVTIGRPDIGFKNGLFTLVPYPESATGAE